MIPKDLNYFESADIQQMFHLISEEISNREGLYEPFFVAAAVRSIIYDFHIIMLLVKVKS